MRPLPIVMVLATLPLWASCQGLGGEAPPVEVVQGEHVSSGPVASLAGLIDSLHLDPRTIRFHVDKSDRTFAVFVDDSLLKTYPCVLGEKPVGDKFHQGDRKTPEGTFTFRTKRVHAKWHKFIWVDYPNAESHRRYNARLRSGQIPAGKDIGGEIGIHGVPEGMDHWITAGQDWTWGCIALRNADVDEIYPHIRTYGTVLVIVP